MESFVTKAFTCSLPKPAPLSVQEIARLYLLSSSRDDFENSIVNSMDSGGGDDSAFRRIKYESMEFDRISSSATYLFELISVFFRPPLTSSVMRCLLFGIFLEIILPFFFRQVSD